MVAPSSSSKAARARAAHLTRGETSAIREQLTWALSELDQAQARRKAAQDVLTKIGVHKIGMKTFTSFGALDTLLSKRINKLTTMPDAPDDAPSLAEAVDNFTATAGLDRVLSKLADVIDDALTHKHRPRRLNEKLHAMYGPGHDNEELALVQVRAQTYAMLQDLECMTKPKYMPSNDELTNSTYMAAESHADVIKLIIEVLETSQGMARLRHRTPNPWVKLESFLVQIETKRASWVDAAVEAPERVSIALDKEKLTLALGRLQPAEQAIAKRVKVWKAHAPEVATERDARRVEAQYIVDAGPAEVNRAAELVTQLSAQLGLTSREI